MQNIDDGSLACLGIDVTAETRFFNCATITQQKLTNTEFFVLDVIEDVKTKHGDDRMLVKIKRKLEDAEMDSMKFFSELLNLEIKRNYQIFPTEKRGVDFVGFVFDHTHHTMRKSIKQNFARRIKQLDKQKEIKEAEYKHNLCGWLGWAKYSSSKHFIKQNIKIEL